MSRLLNAYTWWLQDRLSQDEKGPKKWAEFIRSINRPPPEAFTDPNVRAQYRALRATEPK